MPLLRRKLRCHYCNVQARDKHTGIPVTWLCPQCDSVNHLDKQGRITDPPLEATRAAPLNQYVRSRSPTPTMAPPAESPFCDTCERNQLLANKLLAEYIPDEDDPEYEKYASTADEYRSQLEERYPSVCEDCIQVVQDRIRAAGYAAKADHLRRVLEQSRKYKSDAYTARQACTLAIIWLAKWTYLSSIAAGLIWHGLGMIAAPDSKDYGALGWATCLSQAFRLRQVDETCVLSPDMLKLVKCALLADFCTIWWNPKLAQKTNRLGGHMRGLLLVWSVRVIVLAVRYAGLLVLGNITQDTEENFHYTHAVIFTVLLLSVFASWKSVRVEYQSTKSLMQPLDAHLPSAPSSVEKPRSPKRNIPLPNNTSFDTMAQSFTSSFGRTGESNLSFPPSPTLTSVSSTTYDSEMDTPYRRKTSMRPGDDDMDWTPTQKRFANYPTTVLPSPWAPSSPPEQRTAPPAREPVSIFSKPDPNPFRHRIPAAPNASLAPKLDPWKPGVWAPPPKESRTNFFKENQTDGGLQGLGVPRNVQRNAELFASPKFKYDNYGNRKEDTGLESSFNDLFSK